MGAIPFKPENPHDPVAAEHLRYLALLTTAELTGCPADIAAASAARVRFEAAFNGRHGERVAVPEHGGQAA